MINLETDQEVAILKRDMRCSKFGLVFRKGAMGVKYINDPKIAGCSELGFKLKSGSMVYLMVKEKDYELVSWFKVK